MTAILPLVVGDATTTGAATATVASYPLTPGYFGQLDFELSGELAGDPTTTYSYECRALYSEAGGAATLIDQGVPVELDPDGKAFTVTLTVSGNAAIIQVLGLVGENWVWSAKISNTGRTRLPIGTTSYIDAAVHASVTADFVYTGLPNTTDLDMENVAVAPWDESSGGGAVATKELGTPHGGTRCLRVTGGANSWSGQHNAGTATNQRFNWSGYLRADAAGTTAAVGDGSGGGDITGTVTPGVGWTQYTKENHFNNAGYLVLHKISAGGVWVEADDFTWVRLPIASAVADQVTGGPGVAQATAANRPTYIDAGDYFLLDGVSQYFVGQVPGRTSGTIAGWFYLASVVGNQTLFGSSDGINFCLVNLVGNALTAYAGPVGSVVAHPTPVTAGAWHHFAVTWDGPNVACYYDGVGATGVAGGTPSTYAVWWGCRDASGGFLQGCSCRASGLLQAACAFSAAQVLDLYRATYRS